MSKRRIRIMKMSLLFLFITLGMGCSNFKKDTSRQLTFDSEMWKKDTIDYQFRESMLQELTRKNVLFRWKIDDVKSNLGKPTGEYLKDSLLNYTYLIYQKKKDTKVINYKYLGLQFKIDSVSKYEIVQWDDINQFTKLKEVSNH